EVDASGCGLVFGCAPKDTDGDGLTDCDEDSDLDFFFGPIARFSTVPKPPGRLAAPPRRPAPPSILPQRSTPVWARPSKRRRSTPVGTGAAARCRARFATSAIASVQTGLNAAATGRSSTRAR